MSTGNHDTSVRTYEANSILNAGIRIWKEMFQEVFHYRSLLWRLMVRDIVVRYKQSIIGLLWPLLSPLVLVVVFVWIRSQNIIPIGETRIPYIAFVFTGQVIWLLFSRGVTVCATSLVGAETLLTKVNFPKEVLVFSALGQTVFEFLIRIPLLVAIFAWVGFIPQETVLFTPLVLLPLLLMVVGIGFFVALFNAVIRDIGNVLTIVMSLGIFLTPVVYPPPREWPLSFMINHINPVSAYINTVRDLISMGSITDLTAYLSAVLVSIFIFLVGWRTFHLAEPKIAERI